MPTPSIARTLAILACAGLATGCYRMAVDAGAARPDVYLTPAAGDAQRVASLETEGRATWLFWGLVPLQEPEVDRLVERELARAGADAVTGLEIRTRQTFVDGLIGVLTLGIFTRRTVELEGIAVRGAAGGAR